MSTRTKGVAPLPDQGRAPTQAPNTALSTADLVSRDFPEGTPLARDRYIGGEGEDWRQK